MVQKCYPCSSQEMPGGFQVVLFWDKLHTFLAEYDFTKISPEECFVGCPHAANSHFTNNNWHKIQFISLGILSEAEAQKPSWHRGTAIRKVFARNH